MQDDPDLASADSQRYRLTLTPEDGYRARQLIERALTLLRGREGVAATHFREDARGLLARYPVRDDEDRAGAAHLVPAPPRGPLPDGTV